MRLVSAVLGFLLRKLAVLALMLLALFLAFIVYQRVIPSLQRVGPNREQLAEATAKQERLSHDLEKARAAELNLRDQRCGFPKNVLGKVVFGTSCKEAEEKYEAAREKRREVERSLAQTRAETSKLRRAQDSSAAWVVDRWSESWRWLLGIALVVTLFPVILRFVAYFFLMPLVTRVHKPIHLSAGTNPPDARIDPSRAVRTLPIGLPPGDVLFARSAHVRPVRGKTRGRLLYDWSAPFISFAAGLYGLTRVTGDEEGTEATLATPDDPDSYLMRIDFANHPGLVMRPRHVVGVLGSPHLSTRWRWGLQALATWQVRYILFSGTGGLVVQGTGDVDAKTPGDRSMRMDQNLLMGFDSRLVYGVNRTEVFWPYLWGKKPLVDDEFTGDHPISWQKSDADGHKNPVAKAFDAIFSAIGKLLGF